MDLFQSERRVIEAAESLAASLGDDPNHTVAAAAMDIQGNIYTGVNVHHFAGGPCAELVVLGAAAASNALPLMTMVAAGDQGRGIIPPCGRCRQVLLDQHPDICVAIQGESGTGMHSIRDLLPHGFVHQDALKNRFVRFDERYYDDVRMGKKTSTVRWCDPITTGPKAFVFEDRLDHPVLTGEVIRVERFRLHTLTADQAKSEPGTDMTEFRDGLHKRYPTMAANADVDVVEFRVITG